MTFDLSKYGVSVTDALAPATLVTLRNEYVALVEKLTANTETKKVKRDKVLATVAEDAVQVTAADEAFEQIAGVVETLFQKYPQAVVLLADRATEIRDLIRGEAEYVSDKLIAEMSPETTRDPEVRAEAENLAETIRNLYATVRALGGELPKDKDFPLKERQVRSKPGEPAKTSIVPNIPNVPREETGGRKATATRLTYRIDGETEVSGITLPHLLHDHVPGRYTSRELMKALTDSGQTFEVKGFDKRWSINLGQTTVEGWIPEADEDDE